MRPDAKLGLALGILILGFSLALCCRRSPDQIAQGDPLAAPAREPGLEFLPIRAYQSPAPRVQQKPVPPPEPVLVEIPRQDPPLSVQPLPTSGPSVVEAQSPVPPLPHSSSPPVRPEPARNRVVAAPPETYRVQAGDTLSDIAARLLGGSQRYQELYEANRDKLQSPNDLRIGLELVIPPKVPATGQPTPDAPATMIAEQPGELGVRR